MKNCLAFLLRCVAGNRYLVVKKCFKNGSGTWIQYLDVLGEMLPCVSACPFTFNCGAVNSVLQLQEVLQEEKTLRSDFVHKICVQSSVRLTSCPPPFNHFRVLQTKDKIKNINI